MIKVVSRNYTKKSKIIDLISSLKELKKFALAEKKCLKYEVLQDEDNEFIITVITEWDELIHLESYYKSSYFIDKVDKIADFVIGESEINVYKIIS